MDLIPPCFRNVVAYLHFSGRVESQGKECPATRNRTRDHLIAARIYSQMLCQLSYSRNKI